MPTDDTPGRSTHGFRSVPLRTLYFTQTQNQSEEFLFCFRLFTFLLYLLFFTTERSTQQVILSYQWYNTIYIHTYTYILKKILPDYCLYLWFSKLPYKRSCALIFWWYSLIPKELMFTPSLSMYCFKQLSWNTALHMLVEEAVLLKQEEYLQVSVTH